MYFSPPKCLLKMSEAIVVHRPVNAKHCCRGSLTDSFGGGKERPVCGAGNPETGANLAAQLLAGNPNGAESSKQSQHAAKRGGHTVFFFFGWLGKLPSVLLLRQTGSLLIDQFYYCSYFSKESLRERTMSTTPPDSPHPHRHPEAPHVWKGCRNVTLLKFRLLMGYWSERCLYFDTIAGRNAEQSIPLLLMISLFTHLQLQSFLNSNRPVAGGSLLSTYHGHQVWKTEKKVRTKCSRHETEAAPVMWFTRPARPALARPQLRTKTDGGNLRGAATPESRCWGGATAALKIWDIVYVCTPKRTRHSAARPAGCATKTGTGNR